MARRVWRSGARDARGPHDELRSGARRWADRGPQLPSRGRSRRRLRGQAPLRSPRRADPARTTAASPRSWFRSRRASARKRRRHAPRGTSARGAGRCGSSSPMPRRSVRRSESRNDPGSRGRTTRPSPPRTPQRAPRRCHAVHAAWIAVERMRHLRRSERSGVSLHHRENTGLRAGERNRIARVAGPAARAVAGSDVDAEAAEVARQVGRVAGMPVPGVVVAVPERVAPSAACYRRPVIEGSGIARRIRAARVVARLHVGRADAR